jgi:phage terminase small subunit
VSILPFPRPRKRRRPVWYRWYRKVLEDDREALKLWDRYGPAILERRYLTRNTAPTFYCYCVLEARLRRADARIEALGLDGRTALDGDQMLDHMSDVRASISLLQMDCIRLLGLTPAHAARIDARREARGWSPGDPPA